MEARLIGKPKQIKEERQSRRPGLSLRIALIGPDLIS